MHLDPRRPDRIACAMQLERKQGEPHMHSVHSASRVTRIASLVFACSTAASAQILVGPVGSGAAYQEISAAVAAAPVGASILVQSGSYQPFTVSQGVSIVAIGTTPCLIAIPAGTTTAAIEVTQV